MKDTTEGATKYVSNITNPMLRNTAVRCTAVYSHVHILESIKLSLEGL